MVPSVDSVGLQSVDRLVRLFEAVAGGPASLSAIAAQTGLSDATALRYLNSLTGHGFLERDPQTRQFRVGMRMFLLGRSALNGREFMAIANSSMVRLVDAISETANLGIRVGHELLIVHAVETPQPIRKGASVGERDAWHSSGLGKAILSTLEPAESVAILNRSERVPSTHRTLCALDDLMRELDRTRARGYAVDDEESAIGLRCVAAPIRESNGTARYALSISGPSSRVTAERLPGIADSLSKEVELLECFLQSHLSYP